MNLIWFLLRSSWITVAIASILGSISGACSALLIASINNNLSSENPANIIPILSFIGLILITLITGIIAEYLLVRLSENTIYEMRLRLSKSIISAPLSHLEELGASSLFAMLTEDINSISGTVLDIPFIFVDVALVIGCLVYLCWLSWQVFLLTLLFLILAIVCGKFFLRKAYNLLEKDRENDERLLKHFRTITDGIKELKLHSSRRQAFLTEELQKTADLSRDYNVSSMTIFSVYDGIGQLFFFAIAGFIVFALPQLTTVNTALLASYLLTITYLMEPFARLLEILPNMSRGSIALKKINTLNLSLASRAENIGWNKPVAPPKFNSIELNKLSYSYPIEEDKRFTIGPIDLTIYPGEIIFIIGGNGSGKSTLAKLIAGLYIPESGEIRLNQKPITDRDREDYRQLFTAIFSDFYLFEKILGIDLKDLDDRTKKYLNQLQLERKLEIKEGIFSTIELSQGQRKRLALLTAYLEDRPIYLFDEWAADQDPFFREIFYKQILPELKSKNKTILAITHDDRYFDACDRLIKLDYGQLLTSSPS